MNRTLKHLTKVEAHCLPQSQYGVARGPDGRCTALADDDESQH